jgi:hypothetical protein
MCYKVRERVRGARYNLRGTDQFGPEDLLVASTRVICNPAVKNCDPNDPGRSCLEELAGVEGRLAHTQCYIGRGDNPAPPIVTLSDQFEEQDYAPTETRLWCNPLFSKDGSDVSVPIFVPFPPDLDGDGLPDPLEGWPLFCPEPDVPGCDDPPSLDIHYKCYGIDDADGEDQFTGRTVTIHDQWNPFGVEIRAGRPTRMCEPAVKQVLD